MKAGYAECPLFWVAVVAPPGAAKSASLRAARLPLDIAEETWRAGHEEEMADFEIESAKYEREFKRWKNDDGDPPVKPTRPALRQAMLDDTTAEAAAKVLRDNPRGLVLLKDELIGMTRSLNQYKGGRGATRRSG